MSNQPFSYSKLLKITLSWIFKASITMRTCSLVNLLLSSNSLWINKVLEEYVESSGWWLHIFYCHFIAIFSISKTILSFDSELTYQRDNETFSINLSWRDQALSTHSSSLCYFQNHKRVCGYRTTPFFKSFFQMKHIYPFLISHWLFSRPMKLLSTSIWQTLLNKSYTSWLKGQ